MMTTWGTCSGSLQHYAVLAFSLTFLTNMLKHFSSESYILHKIEDFTETLSCIDIVWELHFVLPVLPILASELLLVELDTLPRFP